MYGPLLSLFLFVGLPPAGILVALPTLALLPGAVFVFAAGWFVGMITGPVAIVGAAVGTMAMWTFGILVARRNWWRLIITSMVYAASSGFVTFMLLQIAKI